MSTHSSKDNFISEYRNDDKIYKFYYNPSSDKDENDIKIISVPHFEFPSNDFKTYYKEYRNAVKKANDLYKLRDND
jgi:hypothetical protein